MLLGQPEIEIAVHISEAWYLRDPEIKAPQGSLKNHPQRNEAVIFNIMSRDCQTVVINPLSRDPLTLHRGKLDLSDELKGRMARKRSPAH